jgi:hypothetical protein
MKSNNLKKYSDYIRRIEDIRNNIAHSQDLLNGTNWDSFFEVMEKLETIVTVLESIETEFITTDVNL